MGRVDPYKFGEDLLEFQVEIREPLPQDTVGRARLVVRLGSLVG